MGMHGMTAIERVNAHHTVWHEFLNVLGILNIEVDKEFADHLMGLQKDPDRYFVWDLLQLHENNQALANILNDLLHPPTQPLESYSIGYFSSSGSYKYYVKGSDETFQSYEPDHQKAYHGHLENKLREHFNKLIQCFSNNFCLKYVYSDCNKSYKFQFVYFIMQTCA